ncbi:MAG: hypothetical protein Q9195_000390 [Heterodermia aff. obscurata]
MTSISKGRAIYSLEPLLPRTPSSHRCHPTFTLYFYSTKSVAPAVSTPVFSRSTSKDPSLALNPPPSTRPPLLELPSHLPNQRAYQHYWNVGKTYGRFYFTGIRNLYQNFKSAKSIAGRLESISYEEDVRNGLISRADFNLVKRQRADALRMPLFLLIFAICGEFTPLVAIFFSGAVPRTLWIPKQVQKARKKLEARRSEVFRNPPAGLNIDPEEAKIEKKKPGVLPTAEVLHIGRSLGLYSSLWDRIGRPPLWLVRWRIKKRLAFVELDDFAIRRDGGVEGLEAAEVCLAAEMRGLDVLGRKESDLRRDLSDWLLNRSRLARQGLSTRRLYLTRPSAWTHHHAIA